METMKSQEDAEKQLARLNKDSWVIMPDSAFRVRWDMAIMVLVLYYGMAIPVRIAFLSQSLDTTTFVIDNISNVIFALGRTDISIFMGSLFHRFFKNWIPSLRVYT